MINPQEICTNKRKDVKHQAPRTTTRLIIPLEVYYHVTCFTLTYVCFFVSLIV